LFINKCMSYVDHTFLKVTIAPPQAKGFSNPHSCAKKHLD